MSMRRVDFFVSNLSTTPDQEDALVEALWSVVERMHPEADIGSTSGPDDEVGERCGVHSNNVTYVSPEQFAELMKDDAEPAPSLRLMAAARKLREGVDVPPLPGPVERVKRLDNDPSSIVEVTWTAEAGSACPHDWAERGSGPEDRWRECWLCGAMSEESES